MDLFRKLSHARSDHRGNVAVLTALAATVLLGAAGIAYDYTRAHIVDTSLQVAADAAALAGTIASAQPEGDRLEKVQQAFSVNFDQTEVTPQVLVEFNDTETAVVASASLPATLTRVLNFETIDVAADATADRAMGLPICILSLEPTDKEAVHLNSDSEIMAEDCAVQINSSHDEALYANSNSEILSGSTCVTGDYVANSSSTFNPDPETGCPPRSDPLASLPVPPEATGPCTHNDVVVQNGDTQTFAPGRYCGKLEINSNGKAIFQPGIHVLNNVEFTVNSNSTVDGSDVMFYLMGEKGRLNFNSNSKVTVSAPTSGTYAGIAFFQDRDADSDYHIINSASTGDIQGVIYFPNEDLHLNSFGSATHWYALIVNKIELNSNSTLEFNNDFELSSVPIPDLLKSFMKQSGQVRLVD